MSLAELIVFEKRPLWAITLRRELEGTGIRVYEVRSIADCQQQLRASPASVLVWEGTRENRARLAEWLVEQQRWFPQARSIVVTTRALRPYALLWREAGAIHAVWSPRQIGQVARIVRRHLAAASERPQSLDETLWKQLPWPDDAAASGLPADNIDGS